MYNITDLSSKFFFYVDRRGAAFGYYKTMYHLRIRERIFFFLLAYLTSKSPTAAITFYFIANNTHKQPRKRFQTLCASSYYGSIVWTQISETSIKNIAKYYLKLFCIIWCTHVAQIKWRLAYILYILYWSYVSSKIMVQLQIHSNIIYEGWSSRKK